MQTFRYKDKRVKYYYVLAFSILYLLNVFQLLRYSDAAHVFACVIYTIEGLIILFFALSGLREKVVFKDNKVIFVKLLATDVRIDSIQSIQVCDKGDLCYKVTYNKLFSETWALSYYESNDDIVVFRNALAELIRRAREANPSVEVDDHCLLMSDSSSQYSEKQLSIACEKRAALSGGLGGWLTYPLFQIFGLLFTSFKGGLTNASILLNATATGFAWAGDLVLVILYVGSISLAVFTAILLFQRKKAFMKWYIYYMVYEAGIVFVSSSLTVILGSAGLSVSAVLLSIILPTAFPVVWILVWKAYFLRSIRARNTLVN